MDNLELDQASSKAILHLLVRIRDNPDIGWFMGIGTESFSLLTEAYARLSKRSVEEIRRDFRPVNPRDPREGAMLGAGFPSPELADTRFLKRMDRELVANQNRGDWHEWKPDRMTCVDELFHHCRKLQRALRLNDVERVTEHAADLANIASKTAEIHGDLE